jgi:hypothetical protein
MQQGQKSRRPKTKTIGLRAKAWWVLRKNRSMTLTEIQSTICTGTEKSADSNLRRYLKKLTDVGVIDVETIADDKLTSNGVNRYTVVHNLGPKAPVVRVRTGQVFDPNSGKIVVKAGQHG